MTINIPKRGELGVTWNPGMIKVSEPFVVDYSTLVINDTTDLDMLVLKEGQRIFPLGWIVECAADQVTVTSVNIGTVGLGVTYLANAQIIDTAAASATYAIWTASTPALYTLFTGAAGGTTWIARVVTGATPAGSNSFRLVYIDMGNI